MTKVNVGTGSTLISNSAEGQLLELITLLKIKELNTVIDPNRIYSADITNIFNIEINLLGFICKVSLSITATQSAATGSIIVSANGAYDGNYFNAGVGGTFKSNNPLQYLLEIISFMEERESSIATNAYLENRVISGYSLDRKTFSATINLPIELQLVGGKMNINVKEYLL